MKYDLNKILFLVSKNLGKISYIKKLKSVTNDVYKIKNNNYYILKVYLNKGLNRDLDLKISKHFGDFNGAMKKKYLHGRTGMVDFSIVEYINGKLLSDVIYKRDPSIYYKQIYNFFKQGGKIKIKDYGRLDNRLKGSHKNWLGFILDLEKDIYSRSDNFDKLVGIDLYKLEELTIHLLKKRKRNPVLVPVDLNLSNFIITKSGKVRIIEIGSWFAGDFILPYGLLLTHAWKTPLYNHMIKSKLIRKNIQVCLFYSLLESLSIISFNKKFYPHKLKALKPFGNKLHFADILKEQKKIIGL